jgi:BirA family biotin operon repressor/biotin-[acetyl-CoA-carboxylase] ligase
VAIEVVDETGSTNADLLARCATLAGPTLRIAGQQTAGRGRAGRPWVSQPGCQPDVLAGVALQGPLHRMSGLPWPSAWRWPKPWTAWGTGADQVAQRPAADGAKLAGILVETQQAPDGASGP